MLSTIGTLTGDQLTDDIRSAHRTLTVAKARFLIAIGEFFFRELARKVGAPTSAAWLSRECQLSRRTAYEYLNVARKLRGFPRLMEVFLAGSVSYSAVRLLLRYLTPDNEHELVDKAVELTYEGLEKELSGLSRNSTSGKNAREYFKVKVCGETGDVRFWGNLRAERGAELIAALKTGEITSLRGAADLQGTPSHEVLDQLLDDARDTPEAVPARPVPTAPPTEDPVDDGAEDSGDAGGEETDDSGQPSFTRHGAPLRSRILQSLLGMIAMVRSAPRSQIRAPGAEVHINVAADGNATLAGHLGVETRELHRMLLNSRNHLHVVDDCGVTIRLGRAVRTVSAAQERALLAKWHGQCGGPGCVHTRFLEFHHIIAWRDGGETNLDNLIPLCAACHALVTAGIIEITINQQDPTKIWFTFPDGATFVSNVRTTPVRSVEPAPVQGELVLGDSFDDPVLDAG